MGASNFGQSRWRSRFLLFGMLFLLLSPVAFVAARSFVTLTDPSPAVGRAQVVTQGISALPGTEYVMRVVRRTAPALGDAKVGRRVLGFALATDEPILITDVEDDGTYKDLARLAPGEAYMTLNGDRQIRASLSGAPTQYLSIEFVPPDRGSDIGTGELLFVSDPIIAPPGQRDVDLVRNVLAQQDIAKVPDTGGQIMVLATDGAIDILPTRTRMRRLESGQSAVFSAEEIEIRPSETSAYGVPANQLGALTSMLQTDNPVAGYVVVVIGPEVPKTGEPTPTPTQPATTATVEAPSVTPSPGQVTLGSIGVTGRLCNTGVTIETISDESCPVIPSGYDLALTGATISRTLADASQVDSSWYWSNLPLGTYALTTTGYPGRANDYFIPGSAGVGGSSATGYTITLDQTSPAIVLPVYFLQGRPQPTTSAVTFTIQACQQGLVNCASPGQYNVDPQPYLVGQNGQTLTAADAQRSGDAYTWTLPAGTWSFYQSGWQGYYYVDGQTIDGGRPYVFTTDGSTPASHSVQDEIVVIQ
jgi:hypothetical protein